MHDEYNTLDDPHNPVTPTASSQPNLNDSTKPTADHNSDPTIDILGIKPKQPIVLKVALHDQFDYIGSVAKLEHLSDGFEDVLQRHNYPRFKLINGNNKFQPLNSQAISKKPIQISFDSTHHKIIFTGDHTRHANITINGERLIKNKLDFLSSNQLSFPISCLDEGLVIYLSYVVLILCYGNSPENEDTDFDNTFPEPDQEVNRCNFSHWVFSSLGHYLLEFQAKQKTSMEQWLGRPYLAQLICSLAGFAKTKPETHQLNQIIKTVTRYEHCYYGKNIPEAIKRKLSAYRYDQPWDYKWQWTYLIDKKEYSPELYLKVAHHVRGNSVQISHVTCIYRTILVGKNKYFENLGIKNAINKIERNAPFIDKLTADDWRDILSRHCGQLPSICRAFKLNEKEIVPILDRYQINIDQYRKSLRELEDDYLTELMVADELFHVAWLAYLFVDQLAEELLLSNPKINAFRASRDQVIQHLRSRKISLPILKTRHKWH